MSSGAIRASTRDALIEAALRVVARGGVQAGSIRSIAREAGFTEGTVYRHFRSKAELWHEAYARPMGDMVDEKTAMLLRVRSARRRLRRWIEITYDYFDRHPEAFTSILLTTHHLERVVGAPYRRNSELFMRMIREGQARGEIRPIRPALAMCLFSGMLLNVPRLISEGTLPPPARAYVRDVASAAWRLLGAR